MPSSSCQIRAMTQSCVSSECVPLELVAAMALLKRACGHGPVHTALHVAASVGVVHNLLPAVTGLLAELSLRAHVFSDHVAPLSLAQHAIRAALPWAHPASPSDSAPTPLVDQHVAKALAHSDEAASMEAWIKLHGALKLAALALMNVARDMRCHDPAGRHGDTPCDALTMVCAQVLGNELALTRGEAVAQRLLQSIRLLSDAITVFTEYFVRGIPHHRERISTSRMAPAP